ncbi:ATP-binding protein [Streptomyces sp. MK7]|uniref:ATP-binding protein n=1 Tax=Streptomyces sp. MK7 TaxID=3067635 RepID=UPI002930925B|nr:ATP-binding protein [Streptomyces sp. MK7]
MLRRPLVVEFTALEEEVAALRRGVRAHLEKWGLQGLTDDAQLCVSELVANVITHVGTGTPTTLAVLLNDRFLRIEVHDPDTRALPTLVAADTEAEGGRGMALVAAMTDRWGVELLADRKVTWCELATTLPSSPSRDRGARVTRAEALDLYGAGEPRLGSHLGRLSITEAEEAVISIVTDLLHWLGAHGRNADHVLDRTRMRFETRVSELRS